MVAGALLIGWRLVVWCVDSGRFDRPADTLAVVGGERAETRSGAAMALGLMLK
jgi:hypothetical protein